MPLRSVNENLMCYLDVFFFFFWAKKMKNTENIDLQLPIFYIYIHN